MSDIPVSLEQTCQELPVGLESRGANGASAYQQAVAGGYAGTEAEFIALLGTLPQRLNDKVDKVAGKQLSDYNYSAEDRNIVGDIPQNLAAINAEAARAAAEITRLDEDKANKIITAPPPTEKPLSEIEAGDYISRLLFSTGDEPDTGAEGFGEIALSDGTSLIWDGETFKLVDAESNDIAVFYDGQEWLVSSYDFTAPLQVSLINIADESLGVWPMTVGLYQPPDVKEDLSDVKTEMQSAVAAEAARATEAEQNIASDLANEIDRAEQAEGANAGAISAEVSRAAAAEQALANTKQANLTTEQLAVVNENPFTDDDTDAIAQNTEGVSDNAGDIAAINAKIPSAASTSNQLADKDFVNSSIVNQASNSVYADAAGNQFATRAALLAATTFYRAGAAYVPSNNDYTIVLADEGAPAPFTGGQTRWKWSGAPAVLGYEFGVNETPFTAGQNAAINSGITASDKSNLTAHLADNTKHITAAERTAWNAKQAALSTEQLAVVNNEPYTAAEKTKLANITEGTPPDNTTLEVSAGTLRVKPQTTLASIVESTAKFAASTTFAFGDFFNNVAAKINGLFTAIAGKVDKLSTASKLYGTDASGAQTGLTYTSSATSSAIVQRGTNSQIAVPATPTDNTHAAAKAYVDSGLGNKVDKVDGKGLSTNDYTAAEKTKLAGIEAGAQVNTVSSVAGKTGAVSLAKSDVGLGNVANVAQIAQTTQITAVAYAADEAAAQSASAAAPTTLVFYPEE